MHSLSASPLRLLYVEDNEDIREAIAALLEADDRVILACATAEEALVVLESQPVDVLITDISLPGMSGMELAKQALVRWPNLWVVFSSGYALDYGLSRLGPRVRSLAKPFDLDVMDKLLTEIQASLGW
jgi:CheY-like chemotaxis protein